MVVVVLYRRSLSTGLLLTWLMPVGSCVAYILAYFPYWYMLTNLGMWAYLSLAHILQ